MSNIDNEYIMKGYYLAQFAIEDNDMEKLKEELNKCPGAINYWEKVDRTLLHIAAREATPKFIEYLVKKGMDVDRGVDEKSPISMASMNNKAENVRKLIELGAQLDASTSINNPLFCAIQSGNIEIAEVLIEAGIDLTPIYKAKDNPWWDTLSYARHYGRTEIASIIEEKLKEQGVEISQAEEKKEDVFEKIKKSLSRKYGRYMKKVVKLEYEVIQDMILKDFVKYLKAGIKNAFLKFVESESDNKPYQFSFCMNPNTYEMNWWSNGNTEEKYETLKGKIMNDEDEKYYRFCPEEGCEFDTESFDAANVLHEWLYELKTASEDGQIEDESLDELCMTLIEDLKEGFIEKSYQTMLELKEEGFFKKNCTIPLRLNFYLREKEMATRDEKMAALNN